VKSAGTAHTGDNNLGSELALLEQNSPAIPHLLTLQIPSAAQVATLRVNYVTSGNTELTAMLSSTSTEIRSCRDDSRLPYPPNRRVGVI
jgi:hypothetical protein